MNSQLLYVFLLIVTALCQESPSGPDQIIELFRHGARSPVFKPDPSWPEMGKLTPVGFRQHYILGKALAKKYPNLIENAYKNNQIYLISSNFQRCIESAGAHLHGLYSEINHAGITLRDGYPIELAIPGFEDPYIRELASSLPHEEAILYNFVPGLLNIVDNAGMILFDDRHCPKMMGWFGDGYASFAQEGLKKFDDTMMNLNKLLNKTVGMFDLHAFTDAMFVNIYDNRTLPDGLSDPALITNLTWLYTALFHHYAQGQQIQRELSSYHMIEAFLEQLESFRQGEAYNTVALFSGHDANIMAILSAFGILNDECIMENFYSVLKTGELKDHTCQFPSFASDVIVEFYNKTDAPYVKMFYRNLPITICNGKYDCPYEEFVVFARNAVGNQTSESYFEKCGGSPPNKGPEPLRQLARKKPIVFVTEAVKEVIRFFDWTKVQMILNIILSLVCITLAYKIFKKKGNYVRQINNKKQGITNL